LRGLLRLIERRVREQFDLEAAWITVLEPGLGLEFAPDQTKRASEGFSIDSPGRFRAVLSVRPHGSMLSGDAAAALEFLCAQLPTAIELCRAVENKLQLERELAERERLAVLGQMAASISHNLKNPLGSIKTILQVQMESPELPASMRAETKMVLDEVGRLSAKLHQLLQFSRPAVRGGSVRATSDVRTIIEEVVGVLGREAERRGVPAGRIVFAPRMLLDEHLARHGAADLFLDTLPYNAHTTASDALWAGLPLVTCMGGTFASRVAGSLLHAAGVPELVAADLDGYESLALRLASEPAMLADMRSKLARNRASCPLFDTERFRRHIEGAYLTMHEAHQRGAPPAGFGVAPLDDVI